MIRYKDQVFVKSEDSFLRGDFPYGEIESRRPEMDWTGPKISLDQWQMVKEILVHCLPSEGLVSLLFHQDAGWQIFVPPQQGTPASVVCEPHTDKRWAQYFELMGEGYYEFGSIHSHPSFPAFQSASDARDEEAKDGIHITLGQLGNKVWDIHSRLIVNGYSYLPKLHQWVSTPRALPGEEYPEQLHRAWFAIQRPIILNSVEPNAHGFEDNLRKAQSPLSWGW